MVHPAPLQHIRSGVAEYRVIFYQTEAGEKPVAEFLKSLEGKNDALHKLVTAGIRKLKDRSNHGRPLTAPVRGSLAMMELRVGRTDIARVFFFFRPNQEIVCTNGDVKKAQKLDPEEVARRALQGRLGTAKPVEGSKIMSATTTATRDAQPHESNLDDIEAYIATFDEDGRRRLAAAEAAIDVAILLYRARERRGLSQAAAAKLAGLQQQAVSRFERPDANPRLETIQEYLEALGYALELTAIDVETGEKAANVLLPAMGIRAVADAER